MEDDEQSAYYAARVALTARYGHLVLKFTPASLSASGQHEASWAGGAVSAGTENELLALVRAAMGDCGGEGHLWVTEGISRDPADSDSVLISQRLECADWPAQERVITLYYPPAHASRGKGMSSRPGRQSRNAALAAQGVSNDSNKHSSPVIASLGAGPSVRGL